MRATLPRRSAAPVARPRRTLGSTPAKALTPPYKVVLLNDAVNTMQHVTTVLTGTFPDMPADEAEAKMRQAHRTGSAVLRVLAQEAAEARCEQLRLHALRSVVEPA